MATPTPSWIGAVVSADVAVPEHAKELDFYSSVLTTGPTPLWQKDLMNSAGVPIIGLGERTPEYAGLPLQWMPHIQVADVAESADRAVARGGRELMHQKNDGGQSLWAVLVDPIGAAFGIIPGVDSQSMDAGMGTGSSDPVGRIARVDLTVSDASALRDFYHDVVGWTVRDVPREDDGGEYVDHELCQPDGTVVGSVAHARGANRDVPPVWMICLPVGDMTESLARVRRAGGHIVTARTGPSEEPSYAVVRDPVGAHVALTSG